MGSLRRGPNEKRALERAAQAEAAAGAHAEQISNGTVELQAIVARREEVERARRQAEQSRSLEQHRHELVDGDPCPLCGATEHPLHDSIETQIESDLDSRSQQLREEESKHRSWVTAAERDRSAQVCLTQDARDEAAIFAKQHEELAAELPTEFTTRGASDAAKARWIAARDRVLEDQKTVDDLRASVETHRREWMAAKDDLVARERRVRELATEVQQHLTTLRPSRGCSVQGRLGTRRGLRSRGGHGLAFGSGERP